LSERKADQLTSHLVLHREAELLALSESCLQSGNVPKFSFRSLAALVLIGGHNIPLKQIDIRAAAAINTGIRRAPFATRA
jgi:hypothetical protein